MQEHNTADGRFRVGLLTATITDDFSNALAKGACRAAEELGCDLFIFPGKYIGIEDTYAMNDALYEYQYNALFDIAAEAELDYIINAIGTIGYALDEEGKREFLSRFDGTPMLAVAAETEDYDYLIYDNKSGICDAVDYLADEGRKHICMMKGDPNSTECQLRFAAYRDSLTRRGLHFEERYASECPLNGVVEAEADALMKSVPEMDAVLCVNDSIAREMMAAVRRAGRRPGTDIAVVGFDDLPFAAELQPPLATVRADAALLGHRAVQKAVNYLTGVKDDEHYVPTKFVPRQSASTMGELFNSPESIFVGELDDLESKMKEYLSHVTTVSDELKGPVLDVFMRLLRRVSDTFLLAGKQPGKTEFQDAIDAADSFFAVGRLSVDALIKSYSVIDGGYRWCLKRCTPENIPALHRLYDHFYRRVSVEIIREQREMKKAFRDRTHIDNLFIRDTLMFGNDLSMAYANAIKQLSYIGADTGYIYLLGEPKTLHCGERFDHTEGWRQVAYFYGTDRFTIPEEEQPTTLPQIFSDGHLPWGRRFTLIAADLYSNDCQYGLALLEPHSFDFFDELELVVYQLSAAVRTLGLLKQQEHMLEELHKRNLALDSLSKIDELTGLCNRRGFYEKAEQLAEANRGNDLIVCYADMDNLKLVNDRFGHNEGDYSLRVLAGCMRNLFGAGAVIGRMGGDEFAAVVPKGRHVLEECKPRKDAFLAAVAETEQKPFKVNMSLGLIECVCENGSDIREALERADELLYVEKTKRKKEI